MAAGGSSKKHAVTVIVSSNKPIQEVGLCRKEFSRPTGCCTGLAWIRTRAAVVAARVARLECLRDRTPHCRQQRGLFPSAFATVPRALGWSNGAQREEAACSELSRV